MSQNPYKAPQTSSTTCEQSSGDVAGNGAPEWQSPTQVRLLVVGLCIGMSLLLYLDRFAITPATDTIIGELKLTKGEFGEAVGAFFLAYALMQIPSGWLTDSQGARWLLALYVVCWSLATIGLGLAQGLVAIWFMRLVMGVMQAGAYPTAAGLLKRWVPYTARGLTNSSVSMGGRSGLLLSLILTVPLMLLVGRLLEWETDRWRVVFVLYGALGLGWAAAFVCLFRDWPAQHPWCNAAEVELIADGSTNSSNSVEQSISAYCWLFFGLNAAWVALVAGGTFLASQYSDALAQHSGLSKSQLAAVSSAVGIVVGLSGTLALALAINGLLRHRRPAAGRRLELPLGEMARSKEVWLMCAINFLVNIGWIFLATWLPQYLIDTHGPYLTEHIGDVNLIAALFTALVGAAAICGGLLGGRATDVFVRRYGRAWGRRLPGMCAGLLVCAMYLVVPQLTDLWWFVGAMIAIAFTIDFGLGATWASYQDIGGRHVASILGCGNMCGNLGAALFGRQIGYLADADQWNTVFYISAGAMLLAACAWLAFDASRPVVPEERLSK